MSNNWKANLLLAASEAAAAGVPSDDFMKQAYEYFDGGAVDEPNYHVADYGYITDIQVVMNDPDINPGWKKFGWMTPVPALDGLELTNLQRANIMMNCGVSSDGQRELPAAFLGFESDSPYPGMAWLAARKRAPSDNPDDATWKDLGAFTSPPVFRTRFRSIAELYAYIKRVEKDNKVPTAVKNAA